jgi:catechol 2,3-dioxygenase-like lactoylglutathione lyase family enzyme
VIDHLDLNVSDLGRSAAFYEPLLELLRYRVSTRADDWLILASEADGPYVTLVQVPPEHRSAGFHRKRAGLNHLAFRAGSPADVDRLHDWLLSRSIPVLYGGPMRMEPARYAVFFEDPDRVKLEYVYRGDQA